MDATLYVYAYLVLSIVYAAGCLQYLNSVSRTARLAKELEVPSTDSEPLVLHTEEQRTGARSAVRAILAVDSAAFACAVLPVAYVAVTGLLGNLITASRAAAGTINPMWLLWTAGLVGGHMFFLLRINGLNAQLRDSDGAALTGSFVDRHTGMFRYYRIFLLFVTVFNVVNTVFILVNIAAISRAPYWT